MKTSLDTTWPSSDGLTDFWLSLFPGWPAPLLDKFIQGIGIDAWIFGFMPAGNPDFTAMYNWWAQTISPPAQAAYTLPNIGLFSEPTLVINLLNPQNSRYAAQAKWDVGFWYLASINGGGFFQPIIPQVFQNNYNTNYEPGIFPGRVQTTGHVILNYDTRLYQNNFQWNYSTVGHDPVFQPGGFMGGAQYNYMTNFNVAPNASAQPFNGVDTILAMHENGADNPGIDYATLYEYRDYRNAYQKYSSQIESNTQLLKQQSQAAVNAFAQDYNDRAAREKADLDIKKLQIYQAIQNDQQSAQREYMTQLIAAQNLKISLQGALRG